MLGWSKLFSGWGLPFLVVSALWASTSVGVVGGALLLVKRGGAFDLSLAVMKGLLDVSCGASELGPLLLVVARAGAVVVVGVVALVSLDFDDGLVPSSSVSSEEQSLFSWERERSLVFPSVASSGGKSCFPWIVAGSVMVAVLDKIKKTRKIKPYYAVILERALSQSQDGNLWLSQCRFFSGRARECQKCKQF